MSGKCFRCWKAVSGNILRKNLIIPSLATASKGIRSVQNQMTKSRLNSWAAKHVHGATGRRLVILLEITKYFACVCKWLRPDVMLQTEMKRHITTGRWRAKVGYPWYMSLVTSVFLQCQTWTTVISWLIIRDAVQVTNVVPTNCPAIATGACVFGFTSRSLIGSRSTRDSCQDVLTYLLSVFLYKAKCIYYYSGTQYRWRTAVQ